MEYLSIIPATALGYLTFKVTSHPGSKFRKKMPNIIIKKRVHIFPAIRVYMFGRVFHLHHWVSLSILLFASFYATTGILDFMFTRGILVGGIIQGLTNMPKGHKKIIYKDFSLESLTSLSDRK